MKQSGLGSRLGMTAWVMRTSSMLLALLLPLAALGQKGWPGSSRLGDPSDIRQYYNSAMSTTQGPIRFTHSPVRVEDIGSIVPMGLMVGAHVTPSDHIYLFPKDMKAGPYAYDVFAPADGFITMIQHRTSMEGSTETQRSYDDYRVVIEHSGTFWSYYDLITQLAPDLGEQVRSGIGERGGFRGRVPVTAGQVIGKIGGRSLDMGVVNYESRLNFVVPQHYVREPWKIHTVDPFDYFDEVLRGRLLALNVRKVPPLGGKIDYDQDGKLVGNWFLEGTNGYAGAGDPRGYWMGHLAIVYHHVDPTKIVISIGDYEGKPRQFWVKGNAPDPAKVGAADGPVKYELIWGRLGSSGQAQVRHDAGEVLGVVLAQVLPDGQLKFEVFPNKTAAHVEGFTSAVRIYER
jgi:hypothetical protein